MANFQENQERKRLEGVYGSLFSISQNNGRQFHRENREVKVGIGRVTEGDLRSLGIPMEPVKVDYSGTPCFVVVESDGKPVQAIPLLSEHLKKADEAVKNGGDKWKSRLAVGIELLLAQNIIQEVNQ